MAFGHLGTLGQNVLLVGYREWKGIGAAQDQHMEAPIVQGIGLRLLCAQFGLVKVKLKC